MSAGKGVAPELLAAAGASASIELDTRRFICGRSSGRFGSLSAQDPEREGVGLPLPSLIEELVGGLLGDGSRIRLTVEVIEPGALRENPWPPPAPVGDGSWEAWDRYSTRKAVRAFTRSGGYTTAERIRGVEVEPHAEEGSPLGVRLSIGYGGAWIALADLDGIEILKGDEETLALVLEHSIPYRVVEGFSPKLPRSWVEPEAARS